MADSSTSYTEELSETAGNRGGARDFEIDDKMGVAGLGVAGPTGSLTREILFRHFFLLLYLVGLVFEKRADDIEAAQW